jgi:hypothetical protein
MKPSSVIQGPALIYSNTPKNIRENIKIDEVLFSVKKHMTSLAFNIFYLFSGMNTMPFPYNKRMCKSMSCWKIMLS